MFARSLRSLLLFVLVAGFAAPARAEITPDAKRIVDRYVQVCGGRQAFDSMRTLRVDAHIWSLGLAGTSTTWLSRPDQRAVLTQLGPFTIPESYDGKRGFRGDPSGKLLVLDGVDLMRARASAWFENLMWLTPGEGGGKIRVVGTERGAEGPWTIVEVSPFLGAERRYWFNDATGLIDRESMKQDQQVVTATLSDYREASGRKVAFRSVVSIKGLPANTLTIEVDSVVANTAIDSARFQRPSEEVNQISWLKTPGRAQIPFRYNARHVWVRARVNGAEPADFLLDTGASVTILDSTYAAKLGLAMQGELQSQGAGATGSARFAQLQTLTLLGADGDELQMSGQKIGVMSVNPFLAPFFWRDCAGVIGADLMTRLVTDIDYDRGTLVFQDPAHFRYQGKGKPIPFELAGNMPAIQLTLNDKFSGRFRVDVGSSSTVDLHAPFVRLNGIDDVATGRRLRVVGGGFGGTYTSFLIRLHSVTLGPFSWKEPMVILSGAKSGALASEDYAGNIGNQILERFRCTFDYERKTLWLEPSSRYGERDRFSRSGVQLARQGDAIKAMQVIPDSPAHRAGIREGDEIASIGGRAALDWTPEELQQLFENGDVGRVIPFEVMKGAKKQTLKVKLADLL
jgi:hypothetical protein